MKTFKNYLYENDSKLEYLTANITYEAYCAMLSGFVVSNLSESTGDDARKLGMDYLGFGRWGKDGEVKYVSKDGKLTKFDPVTDDADVSKDDVSDEKVKLSNITEKLKAHVDSIASDLKVSKESIQDAFKQKTTYNFMKSIGFGLTKAGEAAMKGIRTFNVALKSTFEEMHKTGVIKKIESGAMKVDEVLDKYPAMKKIGGVAIAGFLIYQWQNMSFSGDLDDDYDVTSIAKALAGSYTIKDVFTSPQGLKGLTQLATGIATGITFPWGKIGPATLAAAALYTGAKKLGNSDLAKKALEKYK